MSSGPVKKRSSEVIAAARELSFTTEEASKGHRRAKKGGKKGDKDADMSDLKAELSMDQHKISVEELCARYFHVSPDSGLTTSQVNQQREQYGPNMLTPPKQTPEIIKLLRELTSFFAMLLWVGSILCFIGYGLQAQQDNLYLGIVLAAVVLITGFFSYYQNRKSSELMDSFKNMMPSLTTVRRDGNSTQIDAKDLVPGDIVELKAGNKIPADIRILVASDDLEVNNSSLTGESEAQKRTPEYTHENPLETKNLAFFGTEIPKGTCTAMVVQTGDNSVMGRIARLTTATEAEETPIGREIHHFVKIVSAVAIFLGITFFVIGMLIGTDIITNLVFMIGIIVANVPEGLLATVTVCLSLTANKMATKSVLVKNMESVETLGSTSCICSDKTGTLTQNMMTVANLVFDNQIFDAECSMHKVSNVNTDSAAYARLTRCAVLCNNAKWDISSRFGSKYDGEGKRVMDRSVEIPFYQEVTLGDQTTVEKRVMWKALGDASESALIKFCQHTMDLDEIRESHAKLTEIPFNSANKYQVSVHSDPQTGRNLLVMKGAPERIIARCNTIFLNGEVVEFTAERQAEVEQCQLTLSKAGLRVLGFCELELPEQFTDEYEYNTDNPNFPLGESWRNPEELATRRPPGREEAAIPLCFVGLMAMIDPPRPQVPGAVKRCKTAGIRVIMVTGDHPITAKAIAGKVGIIWGETESDIVDSNAAKGVSEGDEGWRDPDYAPAIVVPGWDIHVDTPEEIWDDILAHDQVVFARTSPQQKLIIVENCQLRGDIVAVTGDGVNDAPALRKADIGVAMGIMGSDVSKEAANMILLDDNFASIVAGIEEGRLIFDNLKKSIAYTLSSNIPEIAPFISFIVLSIPLPLSTVLILCVDLGTDMIPAISMAWEAAESDIMRRPPRDSRVDHLVTRKLISFAYLQIGVIQAAAGFYTYMVVLSDYGYPPSILVGLGASDNWGKQPLFCKFTGGSWYEAVVDAGTSGGYKYMPSTYAAMQAATSARPDRMPFFLWDQGAAGELADCIYPLKNFIADGSSTAEYNPVTATFTDTAGQAVYTDTSLNALVQGGFYHYVPFRARNAEFWDSSWLSVTANTDGIDSVPGLTDGVTGVVHFSHQPAGVWNVTNFATTSDDTRGMSAAKDLMVEAGFQKDKTYSGASFWRPSGSMDVNVASRMAQKEALHHAQCAYFVSIVIVQWADLVICKTRMNSLYHQRMVNPAMNFGLVFETILAGFLCYLPGIGAGLGTRPIRMLHWAPGVPFSIVIFLYDEARKSLMRRDTKIVHDASTGQIHRQPCWLERFTYY